MTSSQVETRASAPRLSEILKPDHNSFNLLRLLAALAVVVSHSFHIAGAPESAEPLVALTGYSLGMHAVHVFFTISGVLIAASLMRSQTLGRYARARALRLLPGLAACVLVTALMAGPLLSELSAQRYFTDTRLYTYIATTLGLVTANAPLPGVFAHNPVPDIVNLPLWTLKYEGLCYVALALLGWMGWMRSPRTASLALLPLMLAWVAVSAFPQYLPASGALVSFLRLSFSFSLGTLAYVWREKLPIHWWGVAAGWFVMALALGTRWQGPVEQVFVAYAVLWAASLPAGWLGAATNKNDLSYGVYIYDWPIAQALVRIVPGISQPVLLTATLMLLLPVAALSWFGVEKPMLALKRRASIGVPEVASRIAMALRTEPATEVTVPEVEAQCVPAFPLLGPARDRLARIAGLATQAQEAVPAGL